MKYTNVQGLPEPLVNAVKNDSYDPGEDADYTVTQLIDPPRKVALVREHDDEIEVDVADEIFRLLGQSVHTILERAGVPERRFAMTVAGLTVTGKIDRFKDGLLQDWKVTTAYRFKGGKAPFEIEAQLNSYAELLRENGKRVERLQAVAILRDWSKLEALRDPEYPQKQVLIVDVPMWTPRQARGFLDTRVRLHEDAKKSIPDCTPEERWAKPEVYAVMKKDRERAVKLFPTAEAAAEFIRVKADRHLLSVVHRPGNNTRCESYCAVAPFCQQWKKLQAASLGRCEKCGDDKVPGKWGKPYCRNCWQAKQD